MDKQVLGLPDSAFHLWVAVSVGLSPSLYFHLNDSADLNPQLEGLTVQLLLSQVCAWLKQ